MSATSRLQMLINAHARGRVGYERIRDDFGLALVTGEMSAPQLMGMAMCAHQDGLLEDADYSDLAGRLARVIETTHAPYEGNGMEPPSSLLDSRAFDLRALRLGIVDDGEYPRNAEAAKHAEE